jgi:tetratricopeptide (TPR) repeat protein
MAITDLDRAIRLDPHDGAALLLRGQAREALGDKHAALADYRQALASDPQNSDARTAASRLADSLPPQPAEQPDITGSVPPASAQPTKPERMPPPVLGDNAASRPATKPSPPQDAPMRIVRGGVISDATAGSISTPGIYHLPDEAGAPAPAAAPPPKAGRHNASRSKRPVKQPPRREARSRAPGFNDAFGGTGRR